MINLLDAPPMLEDYVWQGARSGTPTSVAKALCSIIEESEVPAQMDGARDVWIESDDEACSRSHIYPASGGDFGLRMVHEDGSTGIYPVPSGDFTASQSSEEVDEKSSICPSSSGAFFLPLPQEEACNMSNTDLVDSFADSKAGPVRSLKRSTSRLSEKLSSRKTLRRCKARLEQLPQTKQQFRWRWSKLFKC